MRSRLIILVVALALGATGAIVASRYLQAEQARIAQGAQLVTVLVAQQDLPAGMTSEQLLTKGYLLQRQIPRQYCAASAVSSRAMLDGKVVAQPISKDQQVTDSMFKYASEVGLASSTPKNYVAVAIPYDAARGVGNLLRPGDSVAVFATFEPGQKGVEAAVTKLILPKAKVLAIDQTLDAAASNAQADTVANNGDSGSLASDSQTRRALNPTLTLALTPADAEKVVFAQEEGKVWLGLYSPTDLNTPVTAGVRYRQVVR